MADARVIPIDGGDDRRRTGTAADAVAAGASRAGNERARRRRGTPLLDQAEAAAAAVDAESVASAQEGRPPRPDRPTTPRAADAVGHDGADADEVLHPDVPEAGQPELPEWERKVASTLAFVRRRMTGDVEVDEFGFDAELTEKVLLASVRPLYEHYFRVEARGLEHIPAEGGALLVANHSGTVPLDSVMTQLALLDHHPAHRHLRMLGADLVFQTPVVSTLARRSGTTLACQADAERLLGKGELVGVWPEGFKGIGKPFSERYKLQRFGRGGFVSAALKARVPIVPCSIVGAEEIYPILGNVKTLARLLGLPYVPVTPTFPWLGPLGAIPLPSKWIIEFGEPIATDAYDPGSSDDPMLVFNLTDQVRETIQHTLYRLLMSRKSIFF
ncbi:MAG: lysophospholipid acyltransferase family protein [Sporichthyaceae bacterium]